MVETAEEPAPALRLLDHRLDVACDCTVELCDERERPGPVIPLGRDPLGKALAFALGEERGREPGVEHAALEAQRGERRRVFANRAAHDDLLRHASSLEPRDSR